MCTPIVTKEVNNLALNIFPYDRGFVSCVLSDICVVFFYECYAVHIMSHWFIASKSEKKTVTLSLVMVLYYTIVHIHVKCTCHFQQKKLSHLFLSFFIFIYAWKTQSILEVVLIAQLTF